jgi:hypothetical protein
MNMSARQDIERFLGQWFELTQAEAGAIQSAEWTEVREIQTAKAALQKSLSEARERLMAEETAGLLDFGPNDHLRAQLGRLVSHENRNADLVAVQVRRARTEHQKRAEALRNLRRLQRSYGPRAEDGWKSYS